MTGTPFGAGVDTSAGTLLSFMLACAAFGPSFIPRAQKELDAVVKDRLPIFEDQEELPFIRAIVSETLRWRPVAVLGGTPHAAYVISMMCLLWKWRCLSYFATGAELTICEPYLRPLSWQ
jgi:cytochrome P450